MSVLEKCITNNIEIETDAKFLEYDLNCKKSYFKVHDDALDSQAAIFTQLFIKTFCIIPHIKRLYKHNTKSVLQTVNGGCL